MTNPLDPNQMTASERIGELADILAAGILRARIRDVGRRQKSRRTSENCLDDRLDKSVYGLEPRPEGERR